MIFYDITFKASQNLTDNAFIGKLINKETSNEHNSKSLLYKINELLDKECTNKNFMVQSYKVEGNLLYLACCCNCPTKELLNIQQALAAYLQQLLKVDFTTETIAEISTNEFYQKVKLAEEQSLYQKESTNGELSWAEDFNPEVLASAHFETKEYVFAKSKSQEKVMTSTSSHYKITTTSFENAKEIVESIVNNSLLANRIFSGRTTFVKLKAPKINNSFENEVDDFFARACGTTIVIDLESINIRKNTINSVRDLNQELWNAFKKNILEHANDILFVFVGNGSISSNTEMILSRLADKLKIVDVAEA